MIADAIRQAQALVRKAQEETYDGKCTVTEKKKIRDPKTKITAEKDVIVLSMNHAACPIQMSVRSIRRTLQQRRRRLQNCFYPRMCRSDREPGSQ